APPPWRSPPAPTRSRSAGTSSASSAPSPCAPRAAARAEAPAERLVEVPGGIGDHPRRERLRAGQLAELLEPPRLPPLVGGPARPVGRGRGHRAIDDVVQGLLDVLLRLDGGEELLRLLAAVVLRQLAHEDAQEAQPRGGENDGPVAQAGEVLRLAALF